MDPQNGRPLHAVFTVNNSTNVTIEELTVDGNEIGDQLATPGSGGSSQGIAYINSTGTISDVCSAPHGLMQRVT